jgi:hypothetical protein
MTTDVLGHVPRTYQALALNVKKLKTVEQDQLPTGNFLDSSRVA